MHTTAHPARANVRSLKLTIVLAALFLAAGAAGAGDSGGQSAFILLQPVGCNATSLAQVPGSAELFLGRQLLTADGQVAGITGPNDCSGGNPDNQSTGKIFNRWVLTLSKLNWSTHKLTLIKALLDTSIDPATRQSRAILSGGPMKGAVIRSAYDANAVRFPIHAVMLAKAPLPLATAR